MRPLCFQVFKWKANPDMLKLLCLLTFLGVSLGEVAEDDPIGTRGQKWLNTLFKIPDKPRIRKEYRLLTDEERKIYHDAFIQMKNDTVSI